MKTLIALLQNFKLIMGNLLYEFESNYQGSDETIYNLNP